MTRRRSAAIWRGVASIVALASLLVGVPVMLLVTAGAPVPHGLPSWSQLTTAMTQTGIPDAVILEALAVLCWLLWVDLALAVCVEAITVARGRSVPLPLFARPLQPLAAYLIASVVLAAFAVASRPTGATAPGLRTALAAAAAETDQSPTPTRRPQAVETEPVSPRAPTPTAANTNEPIADVRQPDYVVRSGDTLWDIAARKLGDPVRWPQVFQLNRNRIEPDGRRFTNPNRIWPRWTLELPSDAANGLGQPPSASNGSNGSAPALPPSAPSATARPAQPTAFPAPAPTPPAPSAKASPPAPPACAPPAVTPPGHAPSPQSPPSTGSRPQAPPETGPTSRPQPAQSVTLPTGDVVGGALAAGIVAAIAAARLRSRRGAAGRSSALPGYLSLLTPLVRRLAAARWRPPEPEAAESSVRAQLLTPAERQEQPGSVVIGETSGRELAVDVGQLSGTGFTGEGAQGVLRYLIVAFLQHAASDRAEVWLFEQTATLAPSAEGVPAVKVVPDVESAVGRLEVELVQRTRTLEEHEVPDFAALVRKNPAEPLPALLVVAPELGDDAVRGRLKALVALGRRVGVGIVFSGRSPLDMQLTAAASGTLQAATGALIPADRPVRLYTLSATAATELLAVIAASRGAPMPAMPSAAVVVPVAPTAQYRRTPRTLVHIALFTSVPVVRVRGEQLEAVLERETPVDATPTGRERLRDRGRELLAFLALHPEGAPREQVLAELLPDDELKTALDKLRRDIFNVRDVLRRATQQPHTKFVQFVGERYSLDSDLIDCDVWQVESALRELREHLDVSVQIVKLRFVLSAYGGQLLGNAPYEWVNPGLRENYARRVVDAGQRLSRLLEQSGDMESAIDAAEQALAADRDDEELYRRLMQLQIAVGRHDAAKRVFRELEAHLSEIDAEPAEETARLLRR